jgi:8-oxo-dGTP diphosphatase
MEQHPILATDTVVFNIRNGKLKVLLIEMNKEPFVGKWAVPGGFIGNQEVAEEAAHRVLYDATNVKNLYLEQLKVFDAIDRDPKTRVVSVAYMAIIKKDDISIIANKRYTGIDWFDVDHLPELAYDHQEIIQYALERLK